MALHFIGFRDGSQLWRAMQIFGVPDFIHIKWDARAKFGGELDESDTLIFSQGDENSPISNYTVDDSGDFNSHYRPLTGQVPW